MTKLIKDLFRLADQLSTDKITTDVVESVLITSGYDNIEQLVNVVEYLAAVQNANPSYMADMSYLTEVVESVELLISKLPTDETEQILKSSIVTPLTRIITSIKSFKL